MRTRHPMRRATRAVTSVGLCLGLGLGGLGVAASAGAAPVKTEPSATATSSSAAPTTTSGSQLPPTSGKQSPQELAASPNASELDGKIYVPVTDENSVYLIDPATKQVIKKIRNVGMHPIVLRLTPDRQKLYVDNFGPLEFSVAVIDTSTNTVTKKIPTAGAAYASMSMSHDGKRIYVPTAASTVQVIDTEQDKIIKTFPIVGLPFPIDLEVTPDDTAFWAFTTYGTLAQYSTETGKKIRGPITIKGIAPGWANITKDGSKLYAFNFTTSNVSEIDTATLKVTRTTQMAPTALPLSGTLNADESEIWVANVGDDTIDVIDTASMKIKQVIHCSTTPAYVGFSPNGTKAYVSDLGPISGALKGALRPVLFDIFYFLPPGMTNHVIEYDTRTKEETGRTAVGTGPVAGVYM